MTELDGWWQDRDGLEHAWDLLMDRLAAATSPSERARASRAEAVGIRRGIHVWRRSHEANGLAMGVGHQPGAALARAEMGVEWMSTKEMCQAIPPIYALYLSHFIPLPGSASRC